MRSLARAATFGLGLGACAPPLPTLAQSDPTEQKPMPDTADPEFPVDSIPLHLDPDRDGRTDDEDCDPSDPTVYPLAPEICGDGKVNDCLRQEAGWTDELCVVVTEPDYEILIPGGSHSEIAALGDVWGDGSSILGIGIPKATGCEQVGEDEWGDPIWACDRRGGLYLLDLEELEPYRDQIVLPDPGAPGVFGIDGRKGHTYGSSLETIGDFDGDGFADFVVGNDQDRYSPEGDEIWVFWGPTPDSQFKDGVHLFANGYNSHCAGYDMERAGDLTGDGTIDLIVSDPCINEVWVWSGIDVQTATGPGILPAARLRYSGPTEVYFGMGIHGRGDFDGDGVADLVASAPQPDRNEGDPDADFVALFPGPITGEHDSEEATFVVRSTLKRELRDGHNMGYTLDVGDANGDGYPDLAIGDPNRWDSAEPTTSGATFVFHGPLTGEQVDIEADLWVASAGSDVQMHTDFDNDGRDDLLIGSGIFPREVAFDTWEGGSRAAYLIFSPATGKIEAKKDADIVFRCVEEWENCEDWGEQVQAVSDQTGDGVPDIFVGTYGDKFWLMEVPLPAHARTPL